MKKKIIKIITVLTTSFLIIVLLAFFISSYFYLNDIKKSEKDIQKCYLQDQAIYSISEEFHPGPNACYENMLKLLYPKLLIHKVKYKNKPLGIINTDKIFYVDKSALDKADAVLSYGVGRFEYEQENTFEIEISKITKNTVYAFDCGLKKEELDELNKFANNLNYIDECIGTDDYLMYGNKSSGKLHTLEQKLEELKLKDKKVYLKFGIPEPHLYADDILKNKDNIVGMTIAIDFWSPRYIIETINFLNKLEKDFVIVSCRYFYMFNPYFYEKLFIGNHGDYDYNGNYKILNYFGFLNHPISISLVNKNLIKKDSIYWNQKNNPADNFLNPIIGFRGFQIILFEKIKNIKNYLK